MTDQIIDLRPTLWAIARRWVVLVPLLLLGVGAGALYGLLQSSTYVAEARVLLPASGVDVAGRPLRDIETEVAIASSAQVLQVARKAVSPPLGPSVVGDRITVRSASADILAFRASAGSAQDASLLANAAAQQYVAVSTATDVLDSEVKALTARANDAQKKIDDLQSQIGAAQSVLAGFAQGSTRAQEQQALIDRLRSDQAGLQQSLNIINGRIADDEINTQVKRAGTRVLDEATPPAAPDQPRRIVDLAAGTAIGLVVGLLATLGLEYRDRRLRRRDDIADAVGAPVLASLAIARRPTAEICRGIFEWKPTAVERLLLDRAFNHLQGDLRPPANLVVVSLAGDRAAPLVAVEMAAFAARPGTATAFLMANRHRSAAALWSVSVRLGAHAVRVRPGLWVVPPPGAESADFDWAALTVVSLIADAGDLVIPTWGRPTRVVVAVSSGHATAPRLGSLAAACADAGHPVDGVVVVNPDPRDESVGFTLPGVDSTGRGEADDAARKDAVSRSLSGQRDADGELGERTANASDTTAGGHPQARGRAAGDAAPFAADDPHAAVT